MTEGELLLVQVTAPHFCAGIILQDDQVVRAAPILKWSMGWTRDSLRAYFAKKGWKVVVVRREAATGPVARAQGLA